MPFLGVAFPWETPAGEGFNWVGGLPPGEDLDQGTGAIVPSARAQSLIDTIASRPVIEDFTAPPPARPAVEEGTNLLDQIIGGVKDWAQEQFGLGMTPDQKIAAIQGAPVMGGSAGAAGMLDPLKAAAGAAILGIGVGALARTKFPWETATGEGMIAPWSEMKQLPSGEWVKEGWQGNGQALSIGGLGTMTLPQLQNQVVNTWTNASKDGRSPATVMFVQYANGRVASQSLITGRIKTWRPKKHIVISTNPRVSQISKLFRTSERIAKRLSKNKELMLQHSHAKK